MPLADEALAVLGSALRDPNVVLRYQAKISPCLVGVSVVERGRLGAGHGRKRAELASRAHLARRPAMGLASPVPDRCTAVDAAARRGVARAAVRTDTHANRHVDPARRHAPRRHDLHHLASTAGVDAHSAGRPWSASSASPAPRTPRPPGSGRAGAPKLFPGARPGAHQRAGYLGTSLNEQLGLQIRPGRGAELRPSRRTGRRSTGRAARHLSRHRRPLGRTRQTRLDRLHRRTGRTTLGTPADVTAADGTAPLLCVEWWSAQITPAGCSGYRPLTGHFRGRVLWESPLQVRRSSPTRANFSAQGSSCGTAPLQPEAGVPARKRPKPGRCPLDVEKVVTQRALRAHATSKRRRVASVERGPRLTFEGWSKDGSALATSRRPIWRICSAAPAAVAHGSAARWRLSASG